MLIPSATINRSHIARPVHGGEPCLVTMRGEHTCLPLDLFVDRSCLPPLRSCRWQCSHRGYSVLANSCFRDRMPPMERLVQTWGRLSASTTSKETEASQAMRC